MCVIAESRRRRYMRYTTASNFRLQHNKRRWFSNREKDGKSQASDGNRCKGITATEDKCEELWGKREFREGQSYVSFCIINDSDLFMNSILAPKCNKVHAGKYGGRAALPTSTNFTPSTLIFLLAWTLHTRYNNWYRGTNFAKMKKFSRVAQLLCGAQLVYRSIRVGGKLTVLCPCSSATSPASQPSYLSTTISYLFPAGCLLRYWPTAPFVGKRRKIFLPSPTTETRVIRNHVSSISNQFD